MKIKLLTLTAALFLAFSMNSQDLLDHVPSDASFIIKVDGNNILDKMSLETLKKLPVMEQFAKEMSHRNTESLEDLGIQWDSGMYFYLTSNDTMTYYTMILDINDKEKFMNMVKNTYDDFFIDGDTYRIASYSNLIEWNDDFAIFIGGDKKRKSYDYYYYDSPPEEQYNMEMWGEFQVNEDTGYYGYEDYQELEEVELRIDSDEIDAVQNAVDAAKGVKEAGEEVDEAEPVYEIEEYEYPVEVEEYIYPEEEEEHIHVPTMGYIDYMLLMESKRIRDLTSNNSIRTNTKLISGIDANADASMLLNGSSFQDLMSNMYGYGMTSYMTSTLNNSLLSNNQMNSNMYFQKDQIFVDTKMEYNDEMAKAYNKIFDASINKDFFSYVPTKNPIGYYTAALNTEAVLDEMPNTLNSQFKNIEGNDLSVILDLYSLILDEEAIAELIPGDFMFVVNAIRPIQIEYSVYDYDDNFERTERKETKEEQLPEFLLMVSTGKSELVEKLLNLTTLSNDFIKSETGYYELKAGQYDPMQLFMLEKDGIFFLCNSREQLNFIQGGGGKNKLAKSHIEDINSSSAMMFMDGEKILKNIQMGYLSQKEAMQLDFASENVRQMTSKQLKMKGNVATMETVIDIPKGHDNSFEYLINLMNQMYKIDKGLN